MTKEIRKIKADLDQMRRELNFIKIRVQTIYSLIESVERTLLEIEPAPIKKTELKVLEKEANHWVDTDTPQYETTYGNRKRFYK